MVSIEDALLFRRKSSLFLDLFDDKEVLQKFLLFYISSYGEKHPAQYNPPILWERLSTGYRIIDFRIDKLLDALELLQLNYFCTDKICAATSVHLDPESVRIYQQHVLDIADDDNSFFAIEEGTGKLVGLAMATVMTEDLDDADYENRSHKPYDLIEYERSLLYGANIFNRYRVNKYFCIHILCVKSNYHGYGIGKSLVQACLSKAQKIQCPVCVGIFPAGSALTIAQKFQFKTLSEKPWRNVRIIKTVNNRAVMDFSKFEESFVACMGTCVPLEKTKTEADEINN